MVHTAGMRVGISGKGGSGKTTVAAVLARLLARRGPPVVAVDCDSDPNLALGLGLGEDAAAAMRPLLDQSGDARSLPGADAVPAALLRDYGTAAPDGVTVLLGAVAERAGSG